MTVVGPRRAAAAVGVVLLFAILIALGTIWKIHLTVSINTFLIIVIGAIGLNLLTGTAGQPSLGPAALLAVGGFTIAFTTTVLNWPVLPSLVVACINGVIVHVVVGMTTARLQGLYAILSSLALQAIVIYVVDQYQLRGNGTAAFGIPPPVIFGTEIITQQQWYVVLLILTSILLLAYWRILRTDHGRAWMAIRTRPSMAAALGIPVARYRLLAFALSGGLIAFAGAVQAYYISTVASSSYGLYVAVIYVSVIIVGGLGSPLGCVLGGLLIWVVPAETQYFVRLINPTLAANPNVPQWEQLFQGLLLIACLMVMPSGLAGSRSTLFRFTRRQPAPPLQAVAQPHTDSTSASPGSVEPLLSGRDLVVGYPSAGIALHGVSIEVGPGEVVAIVGPNGAGKTTLVRALSGFTTEEAGYVRSGKVFMSGRDVSRTSAYQRAMLGIAMIPERNKVFSDLTVEENLVVSGGPKAAAAIERALEGFPALHGKLSRKAVLLSGGERQMLAIARALIMVPKVLLVDETTLGLAPRAAGEVMNRLRNLARQQGIGVVLVEQNVRLALEYSDRHYVINRGTVVSSASSRDVPQESYDAFIGLSTS